MTMTEGEVVEAAADAVLATREWGERVYLLRLPYQQIIDASRKKMRKQATPYPKSEKGESKHDFAKREHLWRGRNAWPLEQHATRTEEARAALEKIATEHPAPRTADEVVEELVQGNLREWGRVMGRVSDLLVQRGTFHRST